MPAPARCRIAHLSDLHVAHVTSNLGQIGRLLLPSAPGEGMFDVLTRLAAASWYERRALAEPLLRAMHLTHKYDPRALAAVVESVGEQEVDHVVVTGDLANMGAASELREALAALAASGWSGDKLTVLPGNHDRMNFHGTADFRALACNLDYPFLRQIHPSLHVLAMDTTAWGADLDWRDMLTMNSRGRIPIEHIEQADKLLAGLPKGAGTILCTHHHLVDLPPDGYVDDWAGQVDPRLAGKAENSEALLDIAEARGVVLILFGHRHRATRDGFLIRSIPAACSGAVTHEDPQGLLKYRVFEFEGAQLKSSSWVALTRDKVKSTAPITARVEESDPRKITVQLKGDNLQEQAATLRKRRKELDRQILEQVAAREKKK